VPPRERPAIVLIDEIDAHLHPAWQQTLVSRLSRLFPNIQFIATTHSPLIVGGLEASQVFRFAREEGEVVMLEVEEEMTVGRTDQILTSDLFGLRTTLDTETSEAAARYRVLLGKLSRNANEEKELHELENFLAFRVPASPETPVERHAQHLLELLLRRIVGGQFAPAKEEVLGAAEKLFATVAKGQKAMQEPKA